VVLCLSVLVLGVVLAPTAEGATQTLIVEAGAQARARVPMGAPLPEGVEKVKLADKASGAEVPCQVGDGKLWWILDELAAGATKTYAVELGAESKAEGGVALAVAEGKIDIAIDGKPFTTYVHKLDRIGGNQLKRPYFYPVLGPGQLPMTRPYPMEPEAKDVKADHPHHTSLWVAYGDVDKADNWSISDKAGWQVHKDFTSLVSGPVFGQFVETLDWTTVDKKPVVAETRTVRVWRQPDTARMLDLEVAFEAKYGEVKFGDTKEGGILSTRMRTEFRHDKEGRKGLLVNAKGEEGDAAWGKAAPWVDASGEVEGQRFGYALFDAPTSFRHPTTWHARTYGLLTANPFGLASFTKGKERGEHTLKAGEKLTFRYRLYLHAGGPKEAQVAERFVDYATPPLVKWE
jgi:hypothetical protein